MENELFYRVEKKYKATINCRAIKKPVSTTLDEKSDNEVAQPMYR